jgi:hypothetical protein
MENLKMLSRAEMKHVLGGYVAPPSNGTCAAFLPGGSGNGTASAANAVGYKNGDIALIGMSSANAQSIVSGVAGAHWCCDSCSSASWYNSAMAVINS